ncbi:MAG: TRAP transporter substrate-binding protein [Deltaproteobacteria bacterium]|nr:MAG: TRAP transporter substrate-binding protein [Deltaproteobacteria bacterium]
MGKYTMKRGALLIVAIAVLSFVFGVNAMAADPIVMKIGNPGPADPHKHMIAAATLEFKDYVERNTQGGIKVEVYPGFQLGTMPEMVDATKLGAIQACTVFSAAATLYVPEINLIYIPFLFSSPEITWRVFSGPFGEKFNELWLQAGFVPLYMADNGGSRAFGTTKRQIASPKDLGGLKIRIPESEALKIFIESFGAAAPVITFNQLYTAIQTGIVDGLETPLAVLSFASLDEVIKYASVTNHTWDMVFLIVNQKWFQGLPREYQRILIEAGRHAEQVCRGMSETLAAQEVDVLLSKGVKVHTPTPEERDQFRKVSQKPVTDYLRKQFGSQLVDDFLAAVKEAEKEAEADTQKRFSLIGKYLK